MEILEDYEDYEDEEARENIEKDLITELKLELKND